VKLPNDEKTMLKLCKNAAKTMTPVSEILMSTFHYKGRKAGQTHIVPSAPFSFNDGGRQHSQRPRQQNDCTVHDTFRPAPFRCVYCAWKIK
jgi:hypothetical protein